MKASGFFISLIVAGNAVCAPIDDAINIVLGNNVAISQYHKINSLTAKKSNWKSKIRLASGYAAQTTQEYASGFDAQANFVVEIPIGESPVDEEKANAIISLTKAEQALKNDFFNAVSELVTLQQQLRTDIELHAFYVNKVKYFKEGLDSGITQESDLWTHSENALKQQQKASITSKQYESQLENTARLFGGESWLELQKLLILHIKTYDGQPDSATASN